MLPPEAVYTVEDYWDGPRSGVASYRGEPHAYKRLFDEAADDWTDRFTLTPLSRDLLGAIEESWQIWLRWEAAFRSGATTQSTHPALPEDRDRYLELRRRIEQEMLVNQPRSFVIRGTFSPRGDRVTWSAA